MPMCIKKAILQVDFMANARKVPVKKAELKTYGDMAKHLWNTFTKLASDYASRRYFLFINNLQYQGKKTKQKKSSARN